MNYILNLEEKITCGKIKSKAKSLLIGQIIYNNIIHNDKINTIKFVDVKIHFDNSDINNIELLKLLLTNSTIIISKSPNPKLSNSHILVFPGYLMEIKNISQNELGLNIFFNNFFSNNIPLNQTKLYFLIWFKKIIPSNIIIKSSIDYYLDELELTNKNSIQIIDNNKNNINCLLVQQTQTLNVICESKSSNKIIKKCNFENMCKGFWIKMSLLDYNNLNELKIMINGYNRLILTLEQIELLDIKKIIYNNFVLIFINLEFGNIQWNLSSNISEIQKLYSNSLNCSRIDTFVFEFYFLNNYINCNIQITALSLNFLEITTNIMRYKYFN